MEDPAPEEWECSITWDTLQEQVGFMEARQFQSCVSSFPGRPMTSTTGDKGNHPAPAIQGRSCIFCRVCDIPRWVDSGPVESNGRLQQRPLLHLIPNFCSQNIPFQVVLSPWHQLYNAARTISAVAAMRLPTNKTNRR